MGKDDTKTIEELKQTIDRLQDEASYYKKMGEDGSSAHKSEAVKELFDFDSSKLPQRTRLNEKEIQVFAVLKTNMQILKPGEERMWPELWMDNVMEMKISLKGKGRDEGMGIFQMQNEEKEIKEGYTG